jgi:hypothetical protein
MKIMKLQNLLSKFLLALLLVSANVLAETKWQIATVFLGASEDSQYQEDVDQNIMELSRLLPTDQLKLSIYRELPDRNYSYFPNASGSTNLKSILYNSKTPSVSIPGKLSLISRDKLRSHLAASFNDSSSKKILIIYGHGLGPQGLKDLRITEIKNLLKELKVKLDVLWFDSCFLSNIELLYELRQFALYTVSSQEAEFSAGLPFDTIEELKLINSGKEAAVLLASRFLESYSFVKNGKQKKAVQVSSATISVVDNTLLESFVEGLKVLNELKTLYAGEIDGLSKRLTRNFSMSNKDLIDLGHLLIEFRKLNKDSQIDAKLSKLIRSLNVTSIRKLRTNSRVKIQSPEEEAVLVFGFNDWKNGFEADYLSNILYQNILESKEFLRGPGNHFWPVKGVKKQLTLSPFGPGLNTFNYYFYNPVTHTIIGNMESFSRSNDVVEVSGDFLVYQGYTQQAGSKAEKYTGMTITHFSVVPSIDYFELEFNQKMGWLKF